MKLQDFFKRFHFIIILLLCIITGTFLRLYLIVDQVLLDDEWHGLFYVTGHSLLHLLYYTTADATCAPLNTYAWLLLHTTGWSELTLRLPSLLFGVLSVIIFPLLVRKIHGDAVASIFAVFLSLSPFLTLYSRIFRSYSALAFLGFVAIYSAGIWLLTGEKKFRWLYVFSSIAALYFHPVAAIGVFSPMAIAGVLCLARIHTSTVFSIPEFLPDRWSIITTAGLILAAFALIVQPTVIAENVGASDPLMILTWIALLMMFFGTSGEILAFALFLICLIGVWTLFKKNVFWGTLFILLFLAHVLMIFNCGFAGIDNPVVLARYLIILFPLVHVSVAIGLIQIATRIGRRAELTKSFHRGFALSLIIVTFSLWIMTNPLRFIYSTPNNFTNHPAFMLQGQPHIEVADNSNPIYGPPPMFPFYLEMPKHTRKLIEYPMMLGDHFNLYYYYQHYHHKQIIIGYTDIVDSMPFHRDGVSADFYVNHVIHAVDDKGAIKFRNMVDILNAEAIRKTKADYLICHKNLYAEFLPGEQPSASKTAVPGLKECVEHSTEHFGPPVFEDENILAFKIADNPEHK